MNADFPANEAGAQIVRLGSESVQCAVRMDFEIVGTIREIETIARGRGVRIRDYLWDTYGRGQWRKMKGIAEVRYPDGSVWLAELHWFEAHGIGRRDLKIKHRLHQL